MVGIKHDVVIGVISGSIYPQSPGLLIWLIDILLSLSIMSILWVLSVLICILVLLSIMSTPGSCIIDYIVVYIIYNTGPMNPYIIVILAPPP